MAQCPPGSTYTVINATAGYKCTNTCPLTGWPFLDETGNCTESCTNNKYGYIYYIPEERICLKECPKVIIFSIIQLMHRNHCMNV